MDTPTVRAELVEALFFLRPKTVVYPNLLQGI